MMFCERVFEYKYIVTWTLAAGTGSWFASNMGCNMVSGPFLSRTKAKQAHARLLERGGYKRIVGKST